MAMIIKAGKRYNTLVIMEEQACNGKSEEFLPYNDYAIINNDLTNSLQIRIRNSIHSNNFLTFKNFNTLRTGLLNCLNARSRGLPFRHCASCI